MRSDLRGALALAMLGCLSVGAGGCAPKTVYGTRGFSVDRIEDIRYYDGDDASLFKHKLDIYQPMGATNTPVLLFIHGGGWRIGDKMFDSNIGRAFARHGVLTVAIDYRLSPEVKHPEHIRDCARAFRWIRQHIREYGGNPDDIFITGHSSGAHLAALLATNEKYLEEVGESTDVISGVMPSSGLYLVGSSSLLFGNAFGNDPEALKDASPAMQVDDKQPPFLIIYGTEDAMGIDILSISFAHELEKRRSPVEVLCVEGYGHGMTVWEIGKKDDPITRAMLRFMRKYSRTLNAPDPAESLFPSVRP